MKITFATIVALAAIEGASQVNALNLEAAIKATLNAQIQDGTPIQHDGNATEAQLEMVDYHAIEGAAPQTIGKSKLRIQNKAKGPIYINYQAPKALWPQTIKIAEGDAVDYRVPIDLKMDGVRFWPKFNCDEDGQNCTMGESGGPNLPCPAKGCSAAIDSKFEVTFNDVNGHDWYNSSQVDGWTLPFHMKFNCGDDKKESAELNCTGLTRDVCPTQTLPINGANVDVNLAATNPDKGDAYAGCYSPCAVMTFNNWQQPFGLYKPQNSPADQYCCAGDYRTPGKCHQGPNDHMEYTKVVHENCNTYAWAYDDSVGLHDCKSETATFEITFYDPDL